MTYKEYTKVEAKLMQSHPKEMAQIKKHHEELAAAYCAVRLFCRDGAGHCIVEVEFEDDDQYYSEAKARFTFPVLPADIDGFVGRLKSVEQTRSGEARLESKG